MAANLISAEENMEAHRIKFKAQLERLMRMKKYPKRAKAQKVEQIEEVKIDSEQKPDEFQKVNECQDLDISQNVIDETQEDAPPQIIKKRGFKLSFHEEKADSSCPEAILEMKVEVCNDPI